MSRLRWNLTLWWTRRRLAVEQRSFVRIPDTDGGAVYADQPLRFTSLLANKRDGTELDVLADDGGGRFLEDDPGAYPCPAGTALDRAWVEGRVRRSLADYQVLLVGVATPGPTRFEVRSATRS